MLTTPTPPIEFKHKGLTNLQLQQVLDYIQTHLDRDLSLAELAEVINISPTYFASLFKQAIEISPRQYVIQQRTGIGVASLASPETLVEIEATAVLK
ncbi:hypothetical protein C7B76_28900 [filamentous cyanobacterium CCP2]|nr:hypothetical protein C7B76_28900 [filamentous cyanobacterium CCP2]